jgi:hypothetical protein
MDISDEQAVTQVCFDIQWHYALNITQESDSAKDMCPKTLCSAPQLVIEINLDALLFACTSLKLAALFGVDTDKQRLDSVHIFFNIRRLSHTGIFSRAIQKFLLNLKRHHAERFEGLEESLRERYPMDKTQSAFSMVKPTMAEKTL